MRFDRELYGVVIDPLYVSIYIYDSNVNVSFSDIDVSDSNFRELYTFYNPDYKRLSYGNAFAFRCNSYFD